MSVTNDLKPDLPGIGGGPPKAGGYKN